MQRRLEIVMFGIKRSMRQVERKGKVVISRVCKRKIFAPEVVIIGTVLVG